MLSSHCRCFDVREVVIQAIVLLAPSKYVPVINYVAAYYFLSPSYLPPPTSILPYSWHSTYSLAHQIPLLFQKYNCKNVNMQKTRVAVGINLDLMWFHQRGVVYVTEVITIVLFKYCLYII